MANMDITKQLNVLRKTVYNVWKHYNNTSSTFCKQIPGRPWNIRTGKLVKVIQAVTIGSIKENKQPGSSKLILEENHGFNFYLVQQKEIHCGW